MRGISWRTWLWAGLSSVGLANVAVAEGPFPFTKDWYAERAGDPPGARQVESHGKLWPPYPRATGRKATHAHTFHYAHYWPYPQNCEDQEYTRNIFEMQAANGWSSQTTLQDYHFNSETQQLTDAARSHLKWICQIVPPQYRTVYIACADSAEATQLRVAAAEQYYRDLGIQNPPPVLTRPEIYMGRPAIEVEQIRRMELLSMPRPRLFYVGSATAGASTGGGVAGGAGGPTGGAGATQTGNGGTSTGR